MFQARYALSELRRRAARTILTALGLAAGVGLVIGIIGVSQGLNDAQARVLSPLSKVGTDILVTSVAGAPPSDGTSAATTTTTSTTVDTGQFGQFGGPGRFGGGAARSCVGGRGGFFAGGGGPGGFRGGAGDQTGSTTSTTLSPTEAANQADCAALLTDNDTVLTDLSKLGTPGTDFTHDFFLPATLLTFPDTAIAEVAKVPGVTSAVGGLTLLAQHETGTVPNITVDVTTGEQKLTQTVRPAPMTPAERQSFQDCLAAKGFSFGGGRGGGDGGGSGGGGGGGQGTTPTSRPAGGTVTGQQAGPPDGGGGGGFDNSAFEDCQPKRFKEYQTNVVIPSRQIQQIVNPPSTNTTNSSYTAAGVDPSSPKSGIVTAEQVTSGRFIAAGADNEVLVSASYADKKGIAVGTKTTINEQAFTVVGIVEPALTGSTADIYFTLPKLQELASKPGRINQVLVKASSSADVDRVAKAVSKLLPGAQVVTSKSLSSQVTGSLADAKKLADRLGGALAAIVLASVFAIAMLLTLSSVAKRIREIGTLRAIGWSKAMVVRQMLTETVGIGVLGGLIGIAVGYGVAALVGVFSPSFNATSGGVPSFGSSSLAGFVPTAAQATSVTQTVHLHAVVHPSTLLVGVAFAVVGGLLAGAVGGWRAARMSPAEALRNVG
ncbi:MAG: ABC transporter permease [Acidobacteria bacterium]|nr:ABC transporter permease [Acidobacteriota bacterium]